MPVPCSPTITFNGVKSQSTAEENRLFLACANERFAPVNPYGVKNKRYGIREFVVGTGGAMHYGIDRVHRYSQVRNTKAFGGLQLTLRSGAYDWRFRPAAGGTFTDGGTTRCHGAP